MTSWSNIKSESHCVSSGLCVFLCFYVNTWAQLNQAKRLKTFAACLSVWKCAFYVLGSARVCVSPVFMIHSVAPLPRLWLQLVQRRSLGSKINAGAFTQGRKRKQLSMVHKTFCTRVIFHFWEPGSTHNSPKCIFLKKNKKDKKMIQAF